MSIGYLFIEKTENIDFEEVLQVLRAGNAVHEYKDAGQVKEAFENSVYVIFVFDRNKLVAVARALSDGYAWTLLTDVAILPGYEKTDLPDELFKRILKKFRGREIFTYTGKKEIGFYERFGFERSKNAFTYAGLKDEAIDPKLILEGYYLPIGYHYESEYYPYSGNFPKGRKSELKKDNLELRFSESPDNVDFVRVNEILSLAFGEDRREVGITGETFEHSRYTEFVYDKDKLVGCARAESDGVAQALILNVAIDPDYQGLHLGMEIITRLAAQMKGQNIFLNTHPGGVGFYNRKGFRRNKTALLYSANPVMPKRIKKGFVLPKGYRFPDEL
ncbi:MAG: GNAT family N-acetyltransferase [Lachnospiraceae bacterium]|nr:GNAT family N-acetyltransferase [Lachnospiraceae bacterium]